MEIVINNCFGGFSLSKEACKILGLKNPYQYIDRTNPKLIKCVRELEDRANGRCARLDIVYIPDDCTDWEINEYDGLESITYVMNGKLHHI